MSDKPGIDDEGIRRALYGSKMRANPVGVGALIMGWGVDTFLCELPNLDAEVRGGLACVQNLPTQVLDALTKDEHEGVRAIAATNSDLTDEMALRLASDTAVQVRIMLAESLPNASDEVLGRLVSDDHRWVREMTALRRDLSADILDLLTRDEDDNVAVRALHNEVTAEPSCVHAAGQDDRPALMWAALSHANLPWDCAEHFLGHPDSIFRTRVFANPNVPVDLLVQEFERLLHEDHLENDSLAQMQLAINPATPPDLLDRIARETRSRNIRFEIARNPTVSVNTSDWLLAQRDDLVVETVIKKGNPSPERLLDEILYDYYPAANFRELAIERLRAMAAANSLERDYGSRSTSYLD